ncbi:SEC-C metal-binding domain-containing protein [Anaerolineales bacterium HSG6]|nr:SEC-C metal-binding domain-containing protein [Anaerolineales bacterium HSG6]MDM8530684.1 SEC-C metal-binding domain-containing protein [Anaerolineales bacterium HSG25]
MSKLYFDSKNRILALQQKLQLRTESYLNTKDKIMAKLGTKKNPLVLKVQTDERIQELAGICHQHGFIYIIGFEPDEPEDISDLERALNPPKPLRSAVAPNRNGPCPCGSGKKYKLCCKRKKK